MKNTATKRSLIRLVILIGFSIDILSGQRTIGIRTAEKMVREALITLNLNGPSVRIEPFRYDYAPEFYAFMAWWPNPNGNPLIGYYAVNPWTGDVWDIIGCRSIASVVINKQRELIWKKSKLIAEAEETLHQKSPACSDSASGSKILPKPELPGRRRP